MAVIKDYKDGECHIIVHDDAIRPPEEVKEIMDNVSRMVLEAEFAQHMKETKSS